MEKFSIDLDDDLRNEIEEEVTKGYKTSLSEDLDGRKRDYDRKAISEFRRNPIQGIRFEYVSGDIFYETGRRPDDFGSFFLLAVSEHLKDTTRKPRYLLAARLLRIWRGEEKSSAASNARQDAIVRVRQIKKSHPRWLEQVEALKVSYLNSKNSKKQLSDHSGGNLIVDRNYRRSLLGQMPAIYQANPSQFVSIVNSILKKSYPDAQEFTLEDLINRPLLPKS